METKDLDSYYPGYDDYCNGAKVPFEDYRELEDKVENYKNTLEELKEILTNSEYGPLEMIKLSRIVLEDLNK